MADVTLALLRDRYRELSRELVAPLLKVIDAAEHTFRRDLQKFHILLAVALRTAEHLDVGAVSAADVAAGGAAPLPSLWTNVHSLALSLGVPEETVRRKVQALVRDGWLEKRDHSVRYTPHAARSFQPVRDQVLKLAVANHQTVARVLAEATPPR